VPEVQIDSAQGGRTTGTSRAAIAEAQDWFAEVAGATSARDRLASAYRMAIIRVPVVLLDLGFTRDIRAAKEKTRTQPSFC
jgi:hypothetical protein